MGIDLNEAFLRQLGLAKRAGRAELGEDGVSGAAAAGKARLVLLASPALSVPPGGSFASSDPKRIAAGRAQRRLVFRILLAAWLPPAVVLVRLPQPGIAARTVASWPDRWAASAERLVRSAQLAWVVRHTLLARAAQTVWAVWAAQTAQTAQTAGTAEPVWLVPWVLCYMLPSLARESEEPLA